MNSWSPMSSTTLSTAVTSPKRLDTLESRTPATAEQVGHRLHARRRHPVGTADGPSSPTLGVMSDMPPPPPARSPPPSPIWTASPRTWPPSRWRWSGSMPGPTGRVRSRGSPCPTSSWRSTRSPADCRSRGPGAVIRPALVAAAAAGTLAAISLRDPHRRARLARSGRVWRLSARRGADWTVHRVLRAGASQERQAELDARFVIRSAEDVARELGQMKGALMKVGQLLGFILEGSARGRPAGAGHVCRPTLRRWRLSWRRRSSVEELGADPERVFRDWEPRTGRGGQRRPGSPGRAPRRPAGRRQDPVPGRRRRHRGRPGQRRGALRAVLRLRPQGPRRACAWSTSCACA